MFAILASSTHSHAMSYDELLKVARRFKGVMLETVTGKRFSVGVYLDCPYFTPESSGRGQSDGRKAAERFLARYNKTGSLRPSDYADVTRNASYYVGLLLKSVHARSRGRGASIRRSLEA
jgi:hypothetical protein